MAALARMFVAAMVLLVVTQGGPAFAHAVLMGTEPAPDTVVAQAPERLVVSFNEPVNPVVFRLLDAEGRIVADESAARAIDTRLELVLPTLEAGGYIATWRIISADSHPVGGSMRFAIGEMPAHWRDSDHVDPAASRSVGWTIAAGANRVIFLFAMLAAVGGVLFVLVVANGRTSLAEEGIRTAGGFAWVGLASAVAIVPLQGGLLLGAPLADLFGAGLWRAGYSTPTGTMAVVAAFGLAAIGLARSLAGEASRRVAAAIGAMAAILSLTLAGHAATADPAWFTAPVIALHATGAAFWLGSLPGLLAALRRLDLREASGVVDRFSRVAIVAVGLLVLMGLGIAFIQIETLEGLDSTRYGRLFLGKIGVVAVLLAVAVLNKAVHSDALRAGDRQARDRLARNIRIEIGLIAAVLVLTAALGFTTPPRAISPAHEKASIADHAHHDHVHGDHDHADDHEHEAHGHDHHHHVQAIELVLESRGRRALVEIAPGRAGSNIISVRFRDGEDAALVPLEATVRVSSPDLAIEPVERMLAPGEEGVHSVQSSDIAVPGRWRLRIDALVTQFEKLIFETEIEVR